MPEFTASILSVTPLTHDVNVYRVEKPAGYTFVPGQATEVSVDKPDWTTRGQPFTFTSLVDDPTLEFTIKTYPERNGVTKLLASLKPGDKLLLHSVWGSLPYRGPTLFIAGGAGITPFLSIFRSLKGKPELAKQRLLYSNKTKDDVIRGEELKGLLGDRFQSFLSRESAPGHSKGRIGREAIQAALLPGDWVSVCGPDAFVETVTGIVRDLGLGDRLVLED